MQLFLLLTLAVFAFACGDGGEDFYTAPEKVDIGTLEQPIYMPDQYGFEGGSGGRCDSNWEGGRCWVPDIRPISIRLANSHGCSQFTIDVITLAIQQFGSFLPSDWPVTYANDGAYQVKCNNSETLAQNSRLGNMALVKEEEHDTSRGKLTQHRTGTMTLFTGKIAALSGWQCGSSTSCENRRKVFLSNVFRHELGHILGMGHRTTSSGSRLMDYAFPDYNSSSPQLVWSQALTLDATEKSWLDCYTPGSSTSPSC